MIPKKNLNEQLLEELCSNDKLTDDNIDRVNKKCRF